MRNYSELEELTTEELAKLANDFNELGQVVHNIDFSTWSRQDLLEFIKKEQENLGITE